MTVTTLLVVVQVQTLEVHRSRCFCYQRLSMWMTMAAETVGEMLKETLPLQWPLVPLLGFHYCSRP